MIDDFDRRFLLARYPTGGVVVDLQSGNYYRVNALAALVCDAMRAGGDVEERVSTELNLKSQEAARVVTEVTAGLAAPPVRGTPQGSYHFYPKEGGYVLRHGDRAVLEVDGADLCIRLPSGSEPPQETQLELYVRALAPKLLFQRGVTVLHASCVDVGNLIAFAGVSGAGKTTTARAFAAEGARLISEDLVVLAPGTGEGRVLLSAEGFIQTWASQIASRLLVESRDKISSQELSKVLEGPSEPVKTLLFLDSSRRLGDQLTSRPLSEPDALVALMMHDFLGALESETWRRFFRSAMALIGAIKMEEASAPAGVERLPGAVTRYIAKYMS